MQQVLVVDDDEHIRTALRRCLSLAGYDAVLCATGGEALDYLQKGSPGAVVLDWGLPDLEGTEVCRRLRAGGDTVPVLMLTARTETGDRVAGLDAGADDYLPKPFDTDELLARLRALLRRAGMGSGEGNGTANAGPIRVGDLELDTAACVARRAGREFTLTRTELALLELLMRNAGTVLRRAQIMQDVWEYDFGGSSANLDVYISYVRRKLEAAGEPRMLHTVRGIGYVLRPAGS